MKIISKYDNKNKNNTIIFLIKQINTNKQIIIESKAIY